MNITEIIAKYSIVDQDQGRGMSFPILEFDNYIFSIGVFQEHQQLGSSKLKLNQIFAPLENPKLSNNIRNTLIFAIDPRFKDYKLPNVLEYKIGRLEIVLQKIRKMNSIHYIDYSFNIVLIFIDERIDSQYYTEDRVFKSFKKTFKSIPDIIINGHRNYWVDLYYFISYLINTGKKVVINNWAFLKSVVQTSPNVLTTIKVNEFFEFFPELGFIINIIAITNPNANSIFVTNWTRDITPNRVFIKHNPKLNEWLTAVPQFANPFIVQGQSQKTTRQNQLQLAVARLRQLDIEFPVDEAQQGYAWQHHAP